MKPKDYWRNRFEELEEVQNNKSIKYYLKLEKQYKLSVDNIEKDILVWYNKFTQNKGISLLDAKKLLTTKELEEFKLSVEKYIKCSKENHINQRWIKELENVRVRVHITRIEALKLQLQQQVEVLYGNKLDDTDKLMREIYASEYYHTAFSVQQGIGVGWNLMLIDTNRINKIISKPWTSDGLNFSKRICDKYKSSLVNELYTKLTQSIIRGENPKNLIGEFVKCFNVSKSKTKNLIMTESAFFASVSRKDCFNDLGIEKYEIVSTMDLRTSNICRELDGKVYRMKDYEIGVTAPPFHCHCRTTTSPHLDNEESYVVAIDKEEKIYYIPPNMKYNEWYKNHIKGGLREEKTYSLRSMNINDSKDRREFEEYKTILGNEIPSKFDEYQNIKYNNSGEWDLMQDYYKARKAGNISVFSSFADYKYYNDRIEKELVGVTTSNGMKIESYSKHFIDRVLGTSNDLKTNRPRSGVTIEDIKDALLNPLKEKDERKKESYKFIGEKVTVTINPNTGNLIQCNPTDSDVVRRLKDVQYRIRK